MRRSRLALVLTLATLATSAAYSRDEPAAIGDVVGSSMLASENTDLRGLAFDELSPDAPCLHVLDGSSKIFTYRFNRDSEEDAEVLTLLSSRELPGAPDGAQPANPRGLAFTEEAGHGVFYFLDWHKQGSAVTSQLWRQSMHDGTPTVTDLALSSFRIGDREVLDIAHHDGQLYVCFDATDYADGNLRVKRGIIQLRWNRTQPGKLEFVRHMPDSGTAPSRGLACMTLEGARYLWATVGIDHIYAADARTGQGLFHFDRPRSSERGSTCWGLCFGSGFLWVPENVPGPDRVHRVNVTRNVDARCEGPRILRHLVMTIETRPERNAADPGMVYHYYSRPYAYEQLHCQGVWTDTEQVTDVSGVSTAAVKHITHDPAGDVSSRQHMQLVEYAPAPAQVYSSRYEIDLWTNSCRKFVYPHRANRTADALKGADYLEDDPELFNLTDRETYDRFFERVRAHIHAKYGAVADLENPYWAARNTLEYIQDHYYYPSPPKGKPATVDYARHHYDANPGNLKIALSGGAYDQSQIIACSGTSVMLAGAMRYLGIPARWLGTSTEQGRATWDSNGNGLLDEGEAAPCTNGHRYTQVWLGSNYGWLCFDATPAKPDLNDYDTPPPVRPQWRYMNRAAAGHMKERRIVFNVGSGTYRPLYREFEYDEKLAVDNNCGGDQRYNLQGRFDRPELWKLARHRITVANLCFITDVTLEGPQNERRVTWKLRGCWDRDPQATLSLYLQRLDQATGKQRDVARLTESVPYHVTSALLDLSGYAGRGFRVMLRKDGDAETGGHSEVFDLE